MSTRTISLSASKPTADYVSSYGPFHIKGVSPITFNLYKIEEETDPVMYITGSFGDGATYSDTLNLNLSLDTLDAVQIALSGKTRRDRKSVV